MARREGFKCCSAFKAKTNQQNQSFSFSLAVLFRERSITQQARDGLLLSVPHNVTQIRKEKSKEIPSDAHWTHSNGKHPEKKFHNLRHAPLQIRYKLKERLRCFSGLFFLSDPDISLPLFLLSFPKHSPAHISQSPRGKSRFSKDTQQCLDRKVTYCSLL